MKTNETQNTGTETNDALDELLAIRDSELEYVYEMEISIEDADL